MFLLLREVKAGMWVCKVILYSQGVVGEVFKDDASCMCEKSRRQKFVTSNVKSVEENQEELVSFMAHVLWIAVC